MIYRKPSFVYNAYIICYPFIPNTNSKPVWFKLLICFS